jgi:uncharacterized membrane protein YbhN (UPF0104 family)
MLKTIILNTFKVGLAAGLLYWLVYSGKLDFKLLAELRHYPGSVALALGLTVVNFFIVSHRWSRILNARSSVQLPLSGLIKVTWIGQFFSSVLPGSVSGDLVKILYIQKYDRAFSKKFVFASILIDRVMGLCGLILLVGLSSLIFGEKIVENAPAMGPLIEVNYLLMVFVIAGFCGFYYFHHLVRSLLMKFERLMLSRIFQKIISLWDDLVSIRSKMLLGIGLSILVQLTAVLIFWCLIYPFVGSNMNFVQALAFIPIGLMTLALPVAPGGLGVGHAIFQKLFELSGITNGASLFNLYFVVTLAVNILGVIPYLLSRVGEEKN